ncbi:MAG TPA: P1 family peptidase [Candidatus Acidoferrales bacterium]|nr:P1 family peptidase [Candidatus Acidoferrales bacterium]
MKGLTDIPGMRVGHVSDFDALTGCTAILCESGAAGGVDIRGSASGTQEIEVLSPGHVADKVHGILLAGGSAFGLEAAAGVRRYLASQKVGIVFGGQHIPIVPAAILFDLAIGKPGVHPNVAMGEAAAAGATTGAVQEGCVGAGTGATVGKLFGMRRAMKSGMGSWTVMLPNGVLVSALAAVNALGDVRDPANGKLVAGARKSAESTDLADSEAGILQGAVIGGGSGNTTIGVVATNAKLTKVQANKLAQFASLGVARTIYPVNTMADGDTTFALSCGELQADINSLGVAAAEAMAQSILRAVRLAKPMGGLPALG